MLLGKKVEYISKYDKTLLFPVARKLNRKKLPVNIPFQGIDIWNCYELSWLNKNNLPQVRILVMNYDVSSPNIVESKSLKLYFNSFNNTSFHSDEEVKKIIEEDISDCVGGEVKVELFDLSSDKFNIKQVKDYVCLDDIDINCEEYNEVKPEFLSNEGEKIIHEKLYTNLLKSNCLVTGQPDWASLFIEYKGIKINHENLLKYVISYRNHMEFHEHCVERIYTDLMYKLKPKELTVYARFTRRGGIDINPIRSSKEIFDVSNFRLIRQ